MSIAHFGPAVNEYDGVRPSHFVDVHFSNPDRKHENGVYLCKSIDKQMDHRRVTITYSLMPRNPRGADVNVKNVYVSGNLIQSVESSTATVVPASSVDGVLDWMGRMDNSLFYDILNKLSVPGIVRELERGNWQERNTKLGNEVLRNILEKKSECLGGRSAVLSIAQALVKYIADKTIKVKNNKNITMMNEIVENRGSIPVDVFGEWKERFEYACTESLKDDKRNIKMVLQTVEDMLADERNKKEYMHEFIATAWYARSKGSLSFLKYVISKIGEKYGIEALKTAAADAWDECWDTNLKKGYGYGHDIEATNVIRELAGREWV